METLLYQNYPESLKIFIDREGPFIEISNSIEDKSFIRFPWEYVENFPLSEEEIPSFIEEIRKSHPLLLQIVEKESDLIDALREIKYAGRDKFIN